MNTYKFEPTKEKVCLPCLQGLHRACASNRDLCHCPMRANTWHVPLVGGYSYVDDRAGHGTSFQDSVMATYDELTDFFGQPNSQGDGDKVQYQWVLRDLKGRVVTLYLYKALTDGKTGIQNWHIGARFPIAAGRLHSEITLQQKLKGQNDIK